MIDLSKEIFKENYGLDVIKIEKNTESTVGNVYVIYTSDKRYIAKIYDDLTHVKRMIDIHTDLYTNNFNVPVVIKDNNDGYITLFKGKYLVLYSFLEDVQLESISNNLSDNVIKKIGLELRRLHDITRINKYNFDKISLLDKNNLNRYSFLHFDLTKHNLFYNEENEQIGFIDLDDAKYGLAIIDVAILIIHMFLSKTRGINKNGITIFLDAYYGSDISQKNKELLYIKECAINYINYILDGNEFDTSTTESFEVKKVLMTQNDYL